VICAARHGGEAWHRWAVRALAGLGIVLATAGWVPAREPSFVASRGAQRVVHRATIAKTLGAWRGVWDARTNLPIALWGSHVDAPGAMADPAIAERAARAFVTAHLGDLAPGASAGDFVVARDVVTGELRTVTLQQTAGGRPVIGAQIAFVFGRDRLFAIESHALPHVVVAAGGHAVLPLDEGGGAIAFHAVDIASDDHWDVYRGLDGRELARTNKRMYASGSMKLDVGERYATGVRIDAPAPLLQLTVNGSAVTTAADGTFAWTGSAAATVVPSVHGTVVDVVDASGSAAAPPSLTVQAGGSATWSAPTDEATDAELSTYIYGNIVKARDRLINPAVASWLDQPFPFNVNEDGTCNAFATPTDVHFYSASAMCQNTGRLADIVFHEFGHSFHYNSFLLVNNPASDLSEGLADFNAANITEDTGIGRGFFYTDEPDRDIDPPGRELAYPQDVVNVDPHQTGLIISGALWDLRTELVRELGHGPGVTATEKVFAGILQRAADIPSTYMAALVADDDDADLANGTPHYCAIERAFGRHGLAPGFMDTVVGTPVVDGSMISVAVTPPASPDCPASQITGIRVTWHAGDGVPSTFDLQPGSPWTGAFPTVPPGTLVGYTVEAQRDDGTSVVFPQNPADPEYQLFVGPAINIWCERMDHDPMWTQGGNFGVEWNWGEPTAGAGDPMGAHTGLYALGTQVGGNGLYSPSTSTWIETPAIDVSTYAQVHLQYWRWLTVEDRAYDTASIQVNGQVAWQNAISNGKTLDHLDREWRFQDVDLTPYITDGTAQVKWTLDSDSSNQFGGWTLDDVCILALIKYPLCGDGVVDPSEQCDDGNTTSGDGCSKQCIDEPTAGGGGCSAGGESSGALLLLLAGLARAGGRRDRSRRARRSTSSGRADRRRS